MPAATSKGVNAPVPCVDLHTTLCLFLASLSEPLLKPILELVRTYPQKLHRSAATSNFLAHVRAVIAAFVMSLSQRVP